MRRALLVLVVATSASASPDVKSQLVHSAPDDPLLDALVDIGTIRQIGDELEVTIKWPIGPGQRRDDPTIPEGAVEIDRERIRCGRDRMASYAVEISIVAADGTVVRDKKFDPAVARAEEAKRAPADSGFAKYGRDPRSLVCWAVAHKCKHEPFSWPPPPNDTRFDDPDYAKKRDAWDAQFIPTCKLKPALSPSRR